MLTGELFYVLWYNVKCIAKFSVVIKHVYYVQNQIKVKITTHSRTNCTVLYDKFGFRLQNQH